MERLNKEEIELLLEQGEKEPCISIYMPTEKGREKAKANSIRFKTLLGQVEKQLEAENSNNQGSKKLLEPARKLISESIFWSNQSDGLAYFISPDFHRFFRLPLEFEEIAVVRSAFHMKPLFKLLSAEGQFYILAISQKDVRLLWGTRSTIEELDLSDLAEKARSEFGREMFEFEPDVQFHTQTPEADGSRGAIFHGHGGTIDRFEKERLLKYFRFIDREIQELLDEKNAPLLLASVDYLIPQYKEISKYPLLFEESIKGNPENINAQDLHQKAWGIVKPYFQKKQEEAKARYKELAGTGKTSNNILEILPAAYHGRISELFVTPGVQQWGTYDPETEEVKLAEEMQPGNEDLIDMAAAKTFTSNGSVHAIDFEHMPDSTPVAAIFRW